MNFPCTCCGECCRNIDHIELLDNFNQGDSSCKHLLENNLCGIYNHRPLICRIDEGYNKIFSKYMCKDEFIRKNVGACNVMQERAGIDITYRVHLFRETTKHNDKS